MCTPSQVYYSDEAPSQKLFEVFLQRPHLAVLADPSMLGRSSLVKQMQDIDHQAPFPAHINFSTLWGCYVKGEASQFQVGVAASKGEGQLLIVTHPVFCHSAAAVQGLPPTIP